MNSKLVIKNRRKEALDICRKEFNLSANASPNDVIKIILMKSDIEIEKIDTRNIDRALTQYTGIQIRHPIFRKSDLTLVRKKTKKKPIQKDGFYQSKEWRELRYQALKLYGRQCACCGEMPPNVILHVDHIRPRSKYPELELDINNLQILCKDCNLGKSNYDQIDYRISSK